MIFDTVEYSESRMVAMDHWVKMGTNVKLERDDTFEKAVEECAFRVNQTFKKVFPNALQDPQFTPVVNYAAKADAASLEVANLLKGNQPQTP